MAGTLTMPLPLLNGVGGDRHPQAARLAGASRGWGRVSISDRDPTRIGFSGRSGWKRSHGWAYTGTNGETRDTDKATTSRTTAPALDLPS
jgi:hypothetical protein